MIVTIFKEWRDDGCPVWGFSCDGSLIQRGMAETTDGSLDTEKFVRYVARLFYKEMPSPKTLIFWDGTTGIEKVLRNDT